MTRDDARQRRRSAPSATRARSPRPSSYCRHASRLRRRRPRALCEIRHPLALEALVQASGDAHAEVRDAALEALDQMRAVVAMLGAAALNPDLAASRRWRNER
jgi:hypothetical protein